MKRKSEIIEYSENDPGILSFPKENVTELKRIVNDHGEIYLGKTYNKCMVRVLFLREDINSEREKFLTFYRNIISMEVPAKVNSFGYVYVGRGFCGESGRVIVSTKNN